MAGISKPDEPTLGREVLATILASTTVGSGNGLIDATQSNEWNTNRVCYWNAVGQYVEMDIPKDCNIWRSGTTTWSNYIKPLKIELYDKKEGVFKDVTLLYEQKTSRITETQWEKTIERLTAGRYRFVFKEAYRLDSEWYLESISTPKHLIKSSKKIYTLFEGAWTDITGSIANINSITQKEFELHGMGSLEDLPMDILNSEDEFEVLTWTGDVEKIPKIELTVPEYKPIDLVENPEFIVLGDEGEIPKLHLKGFRDLRPFCKSDNPKLLINTEQTTSPAIRTEFIPQGQLILPKKDIYLRMLNNIHSFTATVTEDVNGIIRLIFSVNSGSSWQTLDTDTGEFKMLDNIEDLNEVKAEGMTIETFNSIGPRWNEVIKGMSVRFGYYLEIEEINDIAEVDKLEVVMDVLGSWEALIHEIDYDYEYDNEKIYIELYRGGSYKINYI